MLGQIACFSIPVEELQEFAEDSLGDCMVNNESWVFLRKSQAKWIGSMVANDIVLMINKEAKLADALVTHQIWTYFEVIF